MDFASLANGLIRCAKCGVITYAGLHQVCSAREREDHVPDSYSHVELQPERGPVGSVDQLPPGRGIQDEATMSWFRPAVHRNQGSQWFGTASHVLYNEGF
jgi:hypothetical protein